MRRKALPRMGWMVGLGCASVLLSSLCGCSWNDVFSPQLQTLQNSDAVDRALRLCSLREGDRPFHLILEIGDGPLQVAKPVYSSWSPAANPAAGAKPVSVSEMRARVEIFWLNAITYRVEIQSRDFNQIRIVNGRVTEEHNTGDFYPRWIQNFVDAILEPVPQADKLRAIPGTIPVGLKSHACISNAMADDGQSGGQFGDLAGSAKPMRQLEETSAAQVCFQDAEPRIASGVEFSRSVWFDDFAPFGRQQIARTLVNNLPANVLVHGQVTILEPLRQTDYPQLKAHEFTLPEKLIETNLVARSVAQAMVDVSPAPFPRPTFRNQELAEGPVVLKPASFETGLLQSGSADSGGGNAHAGASVKSAMTVYIRTDKTGRVREAYRNSSDQFGLSDAEVARAMKLRFKPLMVHGVARQMEAPILLPK
jgi:hypothetical protein